MNNRSNREAITFWEGQKRELHEQLPLKVIKALSRQSPLFGRIPDAYEFEGEHDQA
jgi:hypothetical protein